MDSTPRHLTAWPVLWLGVSATYLATLGWDDERDVAADGHLTGPWEAWQVALLVVLLAAITVAAQLRDVRLGALIVVPVTVTGWWIWSALRIVDGGASFWPIGAGMVFAGTVGGVVLSERAVDSLRTAPPARRVGAVLGVVASLCLGGALAAAAAVGSGLAFALALAGMVCFIARSAANAQARRPG